MGIRASVVSDRTDPLAAAKEEQLRAETERARAGAQHELAGAQREQAAAQRELEASMRERLLWNAGVGASIAGLCLLACDWFVHKNTSFIKWRMKRLLCSGRLLRKPAVLPAVPLAAPVLPAPLSFLPVMLYGPTGSGKSVQLTRLAQQLASATPPVPVALVRFRHGGEPDSRQRAAARGDSASTSQEMERAAIGDLERMAADVCAQVGFPSRDPLLSSLFSRVSVFSGSAELQLQQSSMSARRRAEHALLTLLEVAHDVRREQMARGEDIARSPVLLFDEVHDLIRDDRLSSVGGKALFEMLGTAFVTYGTDMGVVRIMAAGSSYEFALQFAGMSPLTPERSTSVLMGDVPPATMLAALRAKGYSLEDAERMIRVCGTRLRLLNLPLTAGAAAVLPAAFLTASEAKAAAAIRALLQHAHSDASHMCALLDAIMAADDDAAVARPTLARLPVTLRAAAATPRVLFWDDAYELHFQSDLVRTVWRSRRDALQREPARAHSGGGES